MDTLKVAVSVTPEPVPGRWSVERAWDWYDAQPWLVGCNFTPSTAINQLEFWQADTFDMPTIRRELGWAREMGMNTVRVYLHDLAFEFDPRGFLDRVDQFLDEAASDGIRPILTIFDDCWNPNAKPGKQPEPIPGVHNSGWLQSPGHDLAIDPLSWGRLECYAKSVIAHFGGDERVLAWDLYNEPSAGGRECEGGPLLRKVFEWARQVGPTQPLTAAEWGSDAAIDSLAVSLSDFASFHNYGSLSKAIEGLPNWRKSGRPIICSEWLARIYQSVAEYLPWYHRERIGCLNWGLVTGKTQTRYPWGSPEGAPEPTPWFHDLLHPNGEPYDPAEYEVFRRETSSERERAFG